MARCVKCGSKTEKALCSKCYLSQNPMLSKIKPIKVQICPICKRHFFQNKWYPYTNLKQPIITTIISKLKLKPEYKLKDIKLKSKLPNQWLTTDIIVGVEASSENYDSLYEEHTIKLTLDQKQCANCSKPGTKTFEATLQLRNPTQKSLDYIQSQIDNASKKGIHCTQTKEVKGGVDYYLTSTGYAKKLARQLQNKFGGEIKTNARLQTRDKQKSRNVYRISILIRLPDFQKGDIIKLDNQIIRVTKLDSKVQGTDIVANKKISIPFADQEIEKLEPYKTTISKTHPQLEALHPETYQSIKIENPKKLRIGQKVKVVIHKKNLYLID